MRKVYPYVLTFILGFAVCAYVLYRFYGLPIGQGSGQVVVSAREAARPAPLPMGRGYNPVADAVAKIGPAVVNVDTIGKPVGGLFPGLDLPDFFGLEGPVVPKGQASGVIVRPEGYVLTNNHVVADAQTVTVRVSKGENDYVRLNARVVGVDPRTDLAILKIPPRPGGYPYATFGNSDSLRVGDWVIAIGNPLGLGTTVTVGVVSAKERGLEVEGKVLEHAIQTDAAINRGNSGGALSDLNGNLIGINTAIASTSPGGGSIGIGFAIPSNTARRIANELIAKGRVVRPWIGIKYGPLRNDIREALLRQGLRNVPRGDGLFIGEVFNNSPAARAGLQPMDVILSVDGKKAKDSRVLVRALEGRRPGDTLRLEVWHAATGQISKVVIRLGEAPSQF